MKKFLFLLIFLPGCWLQKTVPICEPLLDSEYTSLSSDMGNLSLYLFCCDECQFKSVVVERGIFLEIYNSENFKISKSGDAISCTINNCPVINISKVTAVVITETGEKVITSEHIHKQ